MSFTERLLEELSALEGQLDAKLVMYAALLLGVLWLLRRGLLAGTRVAWRLGWDRARRLARLRSIADITMTSVVLLLLGRELVHVAPITSGLTLAVLALIVAIALPTWMQDLVAGVTLSMRTRFREGDQIRLAGAAGAVRHIGLWRTAIRAGDGGTLSVPNREVLAHTIQVGREQRAAPVEVLLPPSAAATPEQREILLHLAQLSAFRRGGSRPTLTETERGWVIGVQTWSTREIDSVRRSLERQLLGQDPGSTP